MNLPGWNWEFVEQYSFMFGYLYWQVFTIWGSQVLIVTKSDNKTNIRDQSFNESPGWFGESVEQ